MNKYPWGNHEPATVALDPEEDCGSTCYEGKDVPRCNRGVGCVACWEVYNDVREEARLDREHELAQKREAVTS